jgi:hypothetical protein
MPSNPIDDFLQGLDPIDAATLLAGIRNSVPLGMMFRSGELNADNDAELARRRGPAAAPAAPTIDPAESNRRAQMDFEMQYPDPKIRQMLIDEMLKQSRNPFSATTATRRRDFEEAPMSAQQYMSAAPKKKKFANGGFVGTGAKFTVDGRPIDHSFVGLSEFQNARGQPHTDYEGLNYDAAGGSRIMTPQGEMYFSPYAEQPSKEKLDWLTSQPTTESLNAMSPADRANALETWQKSRPGYVDPINFDTFEEYIGAANPTYRVGKDAGNDLTGRANFYGMTIENYQNALSKDPTRPMGVNQAEYGSELLSPIERLAAETARGFGIGPANDTKEFQDLMKKYPDVFDRAFAMRGNWLGKNYPTVGKNFPKLNPLRKYANGGAIDFSIPDMQDGGRFIPDPQPYNKGGGVKKTLDQMMAEMAQKGTKVADKPDLARRGFLGLGKASDFPLAKLDTKALEKMQSELKGAPTIIEKSVTIDPGKGAAKSTLKSLSETPMTRREVLQSAAGQALRGVMPDLGGLSSLGNVAKVAESVAPAAAPAFSNPYAMIMSMLKQGKSEEDIIKLFAKEKPDTNMYSLNRMIDTVYDPSGYLAGDLPTLKTPSGALREIADLGEGIYDHVHPIKLRPELRQLRTADPDAYRGMIEAAKDISMLSAEEATNLGLKQKWIDKFMRGEINYDQLPQYYQRKIDNINAGFGGD